MMDYVRKTKSAVLLLLLFHCIVVVSVAASWDYEQNGPSTWPKNFPAYCNGSKQSPIDIDTTSAKQATEFTALKLTGYDTAPMQPYFDFLDNGHSVQVNVLNKTIRATGASLMDGNYTLEQFHFHWGKTTCNEGSEHTVDGEAYPLEVHFVHYNSDKYDNVSHAASSNDPNALAVIAVFVDVSNGSTSSDFSSLIDSISNIPEEGNHTNITPFAVRSLLPCTHSRVFTYHGSLTTPTCAEVVIWNVFENPIYITMQQLEKFRTVKGDADKNVEENYRPTQPLNGRVVSWYIVPASSDVMMSCPRFRSVSDTNCTMSSLSSSTPKPTMPITSTINRAGQIYGQMVYTMLTLTTAITCWVFLKAH